MQNSRWIFGMSLGFFVLGGAYSAVIALFDGWAEHAATVVFLGTLIASFIFFAKTILSDQLQEFLNTKALLLVCASLHLGILLTFHLLHGPQSALWVTDSYQMHVPGAWDISWVIRGLGDWPAKLGSFDRVYFTHIVAGAFFTVFGASPLTSGLALLSLKLLTILLILKTGERLFSRQTALLAAAAYCFAPTVLFYTISFYKEAAVQLSVLLASYSIIRVVNDRKFLFAPVVCLAMALLFNERPYLFPFFGMTIVLAVLLSRQTHWIFKVAIIGVGLTGLQYFMAFYGDLFTFELLFRELQGYRLAFNSYPDVDPAVNMGLPYPLAVIKILLTPFFGPRKFEMFDNFSFLLIWGSFVHQATMAFALVGLRNLDRKTWKSVWIMLLPFACFIAMYAYIAPYNGRMRDSFYPLLSLLFAQGVTVWVKKRHAKKGVAPDNATTLVNKVRLAHIKPLEATYADPVIAQTPPQRPSRGESHIV